MKIFLRLGIIGIFLFSCSKDMVWEAGKDVTRTVPLNPYSIVKINSIFDVLLVQDTACFATITCGKNLIERVKITQEADNIELSEFTDMNWTRSYQRTRIELHFKQLQFIEINDCVKLESKGSLKGPLISLWVNSDLSEVNIQVICDLFKLSVSKDNFGNYKVGGVSGSTGLELEGSAHFRLENLETDSCRVMHNGIGDCYVNAKRILDGKVTRKGLLVYKPYPSLQINIDNVNGKIIPLTN
jgi:hypothetical protein